MSSQRILQFKPFSAIKTDAGEIPPDSPYAKDVWDIRELGCPGLRIAQQYSFYKLDLSGLSPDWLKIATKKFLKLSLTTCAFTTVGNRLDGLRQFAGFLSETHPTLVPSQMNRSVVLDYLSYLATVKSQRTGEPLSARTKQGRIYNLRLFIDTCLRNYWLDFSREPMIYPEDMPPRVKSIPRFIPIEVLEQLNKHLDCLPEPYMRMVLILQECGMRISELCTLKFDCLSQDAAGDWWLHYYQHKMKKDHTITLPRELVAVVQEQQQFIRAHLGESYSFLFCARSIGGQDRKKRSILAKQFAPVAKPPSSTVLNHCLNVLAAAKEIRDVSGKLWHFHAHQFRHTVGTSMVNRGVPIHIIARYLGHETLQMTMTYAHIHDKTLKEEIAKIHGKIVDVTGAVVEVKTELDTGDLQWFKRYTLAQALPNGSCALPAPQQECPHANACLSCTHFRTTIEFLDQHKEQLDQTEKIIEKAKANGWSRQVEMNERVAENLKKIIDVLEA